MNEIESALLKVSPALATAVSSPIGGMVVSLIELTLGLHGDALVSAIKTDPNIAVQLRQLELQHEETLSQFANSEYDKTVESTEDARKEAIAGNYEWVVHSLAFMTTLAFFGLITLIMIRPADQSDHDIFNMMLGTLGATWVQICGFYFGNIKKS